MALGDKDKIQWHPAFCSAMELELREYKGYLRYEREHNLGKMPLRPDLLVIKKDPRLVIRNDVGDLFLGNNIFEYKSPGDALNAEDLYKTFSYACLYEAQERTGGGGLDADITVSLVREAKPVQLFQQLDKKYGVTRTTDGIYRISGMLFPLQVLVTKELDSSAHVWITALTRTMDRTCAERLLGSYGTLTDDEDRGNADSVLNIASEANIGLFKRMIQEGDQMCEELKEMLAPEIKEFKIRLAEQDEKLADKDEKLADNAKKLADKDEKLADKDVEIARLKKLLANAGIEA